MAMWPVEQSFDAEIEATLKLLRRERVVFEAGLSNTEIKHAEEAFGFSFPPDLRAFLQTAMPIQIDSDHGGNVFPNWRSGDQSKLQERLDWPFEGIAFDIENAGFWLGEWGARPAALADAIEVAKKHVDVAPRLIPVCSHRYLPSRPLLSGNPVFSVYQTDIIVYGRDLWDYLLHEFDRHQWQRKNADEALTDGRFHASIREIPFWSKFAG